MRGLFAYSAVTTKLRAMEGKLIKKQEYEEMAAMGSVTEVVEYLKRYPSYRKLFPKKSSTFTGEKSKRCSKELFTRILRKFMHFPVSNRENF